MELQTVSKVSKMYGISTRMLSYYEQRGLIKSIKKEGYSYRVFDEPALKRLQQVIILRKLQIPVKQIGLILDNPDATILVDLFKKNIQELDSEITALSTIRKILSNFVSQLEEISNLSLNLDFLSGDSVLELSASLSLVQKNIKEKGNITMSDLNQAVEVLTKLDNARVVYLPPMTVASYRHIGDENEKNARKVMDEFVRDSGLLKIKPDTRQLGFEHSTGKDYNGYEVLVSIPDEMEVPEPLVKKTLRGGMYVAVLDVNWYDYKRVYAWITDSQKYQYDGDFTRIDPPLQDVPRFAGLEFNFLEHLNYYHNVQNPSLNPDDVQWEMLFPIKPYEIAEETPEEIPDSLEKCGYKAWLVRKNKIALIGFTKIARDYGPDHFMQELKNDGRLDILNKHRKPGAPILLFHSADYEADQINGTRMTFGMLESDITDMEAFMKHNPFTQRIDASKWVLFEHSKSSGFNSHTGARQLGYKFNCDIITGCMTEYPDGNVEKPDSEANEKNIIYDWYPVR